MAKQKFWQGFATGAAAGTFAGIGSWLAWNALSSARARRILPLESALEKSTLETGDRSSQPHSAATGTYGTDPSLTGHTQYSRFGGPNEINEAASPAPAPFGQTGAKR